VVTFLFTDIEGSTRRWEADAQAMRSALVAHDKVLRTAIESYDGIVRLALANRADVSLGLEVFNRELAQLPYTELAFRAKAALDALLSAVAEDG